MTNGEQPQLLNQVFIVEFVYTAKNEEKTESHSLVLHIASTFDLAIDFVTADEKQYSSFLNLLRLKREKNAYRVMRHNMDTKNKPEMVFYKETYRT